MDASRGELTRALEGARQGDVEAQARLVQLAYTELRSVADRELARLPEERTLQATALVHEAWMRLGGGAGFEDRGHFFGAAARAMRNVLVDAARAKSRLKRGGAGWERVTLGEAPVDEGERALDLLALDAALGRLESLDPRQHEVVLLRYFAGLSVEEVGQALGVSARTVDRDWRFARAWLAHEVRADSED